MAKALPGDSGWGNVRTDLADSGWGNAKTIVLADSGWGFVAPAGSASSDVTKASVDS